MEQQEDIKDQQIRELNEKVMDLQKKLDILMKERPKLTSENLMFSFKSALVKMQSELKLGEGPVDYVVDTFNIDLKVNVTLDENNKINFQLPMLEDIIPPDNLSTLHISIKPLLKFPPPPPNTADVPHLIGMSKERALIALETAQFTAGTITERASTAASGTVIEQNPKPYSKIRIGSPIDLVISKIWEVEVPNLIGMQKSEAIEAITASNLTVGEITEETSDSPPGIVISQSITAGTVVEIETPIDLVVAKPKLVKVPNVIGKNLEDAEKIIKEAKLKIGEIKEKESEEPQKTVIEQNPETGKEVPINSTVDLVVAKPKLVKVPNVIGKNLEDAEKIIKGAKLKIGEIKEKVSEEPAGIIIEQTPRAGEKVPMNTAVDVTLSIPKIAVVPNVVGMKREEAVKVIEEADLTVGKITEKKSREPKDTVIAQEPAPGMRVPVETAVRLTISRGLTPPGKKKKKKK